MNTENNRTHFEEIISPNTKFYLEDSCRAILCGCFSCQMRAKRNFLRWGIPIPTEEEARNILGLTQKTPARLRVYSQISEILERMKFN